MISHAAAVHGLPISVEPVELARIALKRLASKPGPTLLVTVIEIGAATVAGILLPLGINWLVSKFDLDKWFGLQHMEAR